MYGMITLRGNLHIRFAKYSHIIQNIACWTACFILVAGVERLARAQLLGFSITSEYQLSNDIRVDEADGLVKARLAEIEQAIAGEHWDEVVAGIREVVARAGNQLVNVTAKLRGVPPRYITVQEYCQLLAAGLPAEGLKRYRRIVDPNCRSWVERGLETGDAGLLTRVVETELASSYADLALWFLGEWALQEGRWNEARYFWHQLLPLPGEKTAFPTWRTVATCRYSPPAIRARLILTTILEGDLAQARRELAEFSVNHPGEVGRMAGRETVLAKALGDLLAEAEKWPSPMPSREWTTFACSVDRHARLLSPFEITGLAWRWSLPELPRAYVTLWSESVSPPLMAENTKPLAFFPVIVKQSVFVSGLDRIYGFDLKTGRPLWGGSSPEVFSLPSSQNPESLIPVNTIGGRRLTVTVHRNRLYARVGSPVTIAPVLMPGIVRQKNVLVCLDLLQEGKLLWSAEAPGDGWSFEGSPLVIDDDVFVLMRRSDVPAHVYLACISNETGAIKWQRFVCAADSPGRCMVYEITHSLPTLAEDTLFLNTNAGAIAAVSRHSGNIRWITCYPRVTRGDLASWEAFRFREPNPCLYNNGEIYVAPTDTPAVLALDAFSGMILWATSQQGEKIQHLLGVIGNYLIATGDRIYWIALDGAHMGQIVARWPLGSESLGHGRGLIAGRYVYWPTKEGIYIIDGYTAQPRRVMPLSVWGLEGGHLAFCDDYLVVASSRELAAFRTAPITLDFFRSAEEE